MLLLEPLLQLLLLGLALRNGFGVALQTRFRGFVLLALLLEHLLDVVHAPLDVVHALLVVLEHLLQVVHLEAHVARRGLQLLGGGGGGGGGLVLGHGGEQALVGVRVARELAQRLEVVQWALLPLGEVRAAGRHVGLGRCADGEDLLVDHPGGRLLTHLLDVPDLRRLEESLGGVADFRLRLFVAQAEGLVGEGGGCKLQLVGPHIIDRLEVGLVEEGSPGA